MIWFPLLTLSPPSREYPQPEGSNLVNPMSSLVVCVSFAFLKFWFFSCTHLDKTGVHLLPKCFTLLHHCQLLIFQTFGVPLSSPSISPVLVPPQWANWKMLLVLVRAQAVCEGHCKVSRDSSAHPLKLWVYCLSSATLPSPAECSPCISAPSKSISSSSDLGTPNCWCAWFSLCQHSPLQILSKSTPRFVIMLCQSQHCSGMSSIIKFSPNKFHSLSRYLTMVWRMIVFQFKYLL